MTFQEALKARLDLMHPTQKQLNDFIENHPLPLTPLVEDLVKDLVAKGKGVFFVSGGFEEMIIPLAKKMGVGAENVHANQLLFEENGDFKSHNPERHTSRTGGKKEVVKEIKKKYGYKKLVMIGDGVTDGEARSDDGEGADLFIGFGGNQVGFWVVGEEGGGNCLGVGEFVCLFIYLILFFIFFFFFNFYFLGERTC